MTERGEPELVVRPDEASAARAAAERIADVLAAAIAAGGVARWATTGGSAPGPIYRALVAPPLRDRVDWHRVELWFGDDRFVPRDHPLSNVRLVDEVLLAADGGVPIPPEQVHPVPVDEVLLRGGGPAEAARRYAGELTSGVTITDGLPVFDLVIVGIGPDGHVLSVFPGSEAIGSAEMVLPIPAPTHVEPHVPRVTLNPATLDIQPELFAIAFSGSKAAILGDIFGPTRDEVRWPSQRVRRSGAVWFLDQAAAAGLPPERGAP
ncbi:MAG TPA: 6-phosphogluconolactonase [Candidatus Dormibacteraeota bacterium]|nr:6-phosphogluconolactonase [Candidatus Dormibacteraeota bacterium]